MPDTQKPLIPTDGTLPEGPFVQVIVRGFVGKPVYTTAVFDAEKLFGHPQIVEIIQNGVKEAVKATLLGAMDANIFLLKVKPEGDQ